jgi:hypothetical protein
MYQPMVENHAAQHRAELKARAAAARAKAARKAAPVSALQVLRSWTSPGRTRHSVPVVARPRTA